MGIFTVTLNMFVASITLSFTIPDLEYNHKLMDIIKELGKDLRSINLLIADETDSGSMSKYKKPVIDYIIEGCPKLKNLTLESLRGWKESPNSQILWLFV